MLRLFLSEVPTFLQVIIPSNARFGILWEYSANLSRNSRVTELEMLRYWYGAMIGHFKARRLLFSVKRENSSLAKVGNVTRMRR